MPGVNLIPVDVVRARLRRQRVRFWLLVGGIAWLVASGPVAREVGARHQLRSQQAAVDAISDELEHAQTRCSRNAERLKELQEQFSRAERLRYKRPWTAMVSAITRSLPGRLWLSSIATEPPRPAVSGEPFPTARRADRAAPTGSPGAGGYDSLAGKVGPRRLVLEGHALGLEEIYALVDALQNLNIFASVGIRSVSSDTVEEIKVTHFAVECDW